MVDFSLKAQDGFSAYEYVGVCIRVSYRSDIHDLDGCQLSCSNMATLGAGRKDAGEDRMKKKTEGEIRQKREET